MMGWSHKLGRSSSGKNPDAVNRFGTRWACAGMVAVLSVVLGSSGCQSCSDARIACSDSGLNDAMIGRWEVPPEELSWVKDRMGANWSALEEVSFELRADGTCTIVGMLDDCDDGPPRILSGEGRWTFEKNGFCAHWVYVTLPRDETHFGYGRGYPIRWSFGGLMIDASEGDLDAPYAILYLYKVRVE